METDVTIISSKIDNNMVNNYPNYQVIRDNFTLDDILKYPKVLFFNCLFNYSKEEIDNLYKILNNKHIKYINITNNIEEVLCTNNLIIFNNSEIVFKGEIKDALTKEKLWTSASLDLPFIVKLSLLLKDYDLIDKIYYSKEDLEGALWK